MNRVDRKPPSPKIAETLEKPVSEWTDPEREEVCEWIVMDQLTYLHQLARHYYSRNYSSVDAQDIAQDIVQDAIFKFWYFLKNLRSEHLRETKVSDAGSLVNFLVGWLTTSVRFSAYERKPRLGKYSENIQRELKEHSENVHRWLTIATPKEEDLLLSREKLQILEDCLDRLRDQDLEQYLFLMLSLRGMDNQEIADTMNVPRNYVRQQSGLAKLKLKRSFNNFYKEEIKDSFDMPEASPHRFPDNWYRDKLYQMLLVVDLTDEDISLLTPHLDLGLQTLADNQEQVNNIRKETEVLKAETEEIVSRLLANAAMMER